MNTNAAIIVTNAIMVIAVFINSLGGKYSINSHVIDVKWDNGSNLMMIEESIADSFAIMCSQWANIQLSKNRNG